MASGSEAATYCAQADEHNAMGAVDESSLNTKLQMEKRLRKFHGLKAGLPAPHLSIGGRRAKTTDWMNEGDEIELLAIGWEAPVTYFKTSCAAMNCEGGRSRICTTRISGRSAPRSFRDW